ncbi:MAG: plastocyanin/azurin family copper-binding protein [Candidatus Krumholzibacteriia bacterium]
MKNTLTTFLLSALLIALAGSALAADVNVTQTGFTFDPADVTIQAGDTVIWSWSTGAHTVTSGVDLGDPDAGDLFDATLDSANPTFSFTFNDAGVFPYFCRPHVSLGMTGTIRVEGSVAAEATSWHAVKSLFQ